MASCSYDMKYEHDGFGQWVTSICFKSASFNVTIIQDCAPTDSEVDTFCHQLQEIIDQTPKKDTLVVQGDRNAKVGKDGQADWGELYGPYCNVEREVSDFRVCNL